jgi:isocitrate dehydrogenase kinase/phosphatase
MNFPHDWVKNFHPSSSFQAVLEQVFSTWCFGMKTEEPNFDIEIYILLYLLRRYADLLKSSMNVITEWLILTIK